MQDISSNKTRQMIWKMGRVKELGEVPIISSVAVSVWRPSCVDVPCSLQWWWSGPYRSRIQPNGKCKPNVQIFCFTLKSLDLRRPSEGLIEQFSDFHEVILRLHPTCILTLHLHQARDTPNQKGYLDKVTDYDVLCPLEESLLCRTDYELRESSCPWQFLSLDTSVVVRSYLSSCRERERENRFEVILSRHLPKQIWISGSFPRRRFFFCSKFTSMKRYLLFRSSSLQKASRISCDILRDETISPSNDRISRVILRLLHKTIDIFDEDRLRYAQMFIITGACHFWHDSFFSNLKVHPIEIHTLTHTNWQTSIARSSLYLEVHEKFTKNDRWARENEKELQSVQSRGFLKLYNEKDMPNERISDESYRMMMRARKKRRINAKTRNGQRRMKAIARRRRPANGNHRDMD